VEDSTNKTFDLLLKLDAKDISLISKLFMPPAVWVWPDTDLESVEVKNQKPCRAGRSPYLNP